MVNESLLLLTAACSVVLTLQLSDLTTVRKLTLTGANFGSVAYLTGTAISFALLTQPKPPTMYAPDPTAWTAMPLLQIASWTDTAIVAYSVLDAAFLQA